MYDISEIFPVIDVTIFPESGRIKRGKKVSLKKGENKLCIKKIPDAVTVDSVRVEVSSPLKVKFLDIYVEDQLITNFDENKYRTYSGEIDKLSFEIKKLENLIFNLNDEFMLFLEKEKLSEFIENDRSKPVNITNWDEFLSFMKKKLSDNRFKFRDEIFKWLELKEKLRAAHDNIKIYESYDQVKEHNIYVILEASEDINEDIKIYYIQNNISWYPAYNIRADVNKKLLYITMFGMISQATGEDWDNVEILLSTAIPNENCDIPELRSKRIRENQAEIIIQPSMPSKQVDPFNGLVCDEVAEESVKMDREMADEKKSMPGMMKRKSRMGSKKESISLSSSMAQPMAKTVMNKVSKDSSKGYSESIENNMPGEMATGGLSGKPLPAAEKSIGSQLKVYNLLDKNLRDALLSLNNLPGIYNEYNSYIYNTFTPQIEKSHGYRINEFFLKRINPYSSMGGYDYRYKVLKSKNLIPSIGKPVQVSVETREVPMELVFITIPAEKPYVYLKALFKNNASPLPSGPAQIFMDNEFLGNIILPTISLNQGSYISLGIDQDIKVIRKENSKRRTAGIVSKDIVTDFETDIEVKNNKTGAIKLEIFDRVPNSANEKEIEIMNKTFSIKPDKASNRNINYWVKDLKPGEKITLNTKYSVKHGQDYRLTMSKSTSSHYEF